MILCANVGPVYVIRFARNKYESSSGACVTAGVSACVSAGVRGFSSLLGIERSRIFISPPRASVFVGAR